MNPTPFTNGKGHFTGTVDGKKRSVDFDNKNCDYITWSCGFPDLYPWDKYASLTFYSGWGQQGQPNDYTLALPCGLGVSKIELLDTHGAEIAYSMPFNIPGSASVGADWYLPGAKPYPASGSAELARADTGPGRKVVITASGKAQYSGGESPSGPVASNIDPMLLDFSDGTKSPVTIKNVLGHRFYAYIVPKGKNLTGVTAFDAAGIALPVQKNAQ